MDKEKIKKKFKMIINSSLKKYDYKTYNFNLISSQLECSIIIDIVDELYTIFKNKHNIIDNLVVQLMVNIKYAFFILALEQKIENMDINIVSNIIDSIISDIIFDPSNGLFLE